MLRLKNKRKKSNRMRAQTTHGWGAKKKHRGSGNRGGVGMAGTGKRADQKKPSILQKYGNSYYGKKGFSSLKKRLKTINLYYINDHAESISLSKENGLYVIDLKKLGYNKLLGSGNITKKVKVICESASKNAISKIKEHGGDVVIKNQKSLEEVSNA
ncbi:uL15 family ribosomal protein [Candidatus Woesearchaeota archaeon]|nr:hypothetical protein [uncultured archaeon]AQS32286.1 hypothetical protein [uncultured archaeon]MBS3149401.1 uL15 family ribosomal protein [Candidatus Woesearchaeota archaeon]